MRGKRPKTVGWSSARARDVLAEADVRSITVSQDGPDADSWREGARAYLYVRDPDAGGEFERRWSGIVMSVPGATGPLLDMLEAADAAFGIVSGGLAAHATVDDAAREAYGGGDYQRCTPALVERIDEDGVRWRATRTKLRRLYPVTVIGPEIWAQLPPMPTFDSMPNVEEQGNCKVLPAWPTLCDPRDPGFLRATRDLRAWLWPYTIQNPLDHVDNDP